MHPLYRTSLFVRITTDYNIIHKAVKYVLIVSLHWHLICFFQQRSSVDTGIINANLFIEESDCVDTGTIKRIYSQRRLTVLNHLHEFSILSVTNNIHTKLCSLISQDMPLYVQHVLPQNENMFSSL